MQTQQDESIHCQIDRAVKPPGLIASASTYRLILTAEGLYLIRVGRAMGPKVKSRDPIADALAGVMINRMEKKLEAALQKVEDEELPGRSPRELLSRPKSYLITPASVIAIRSSRPGPNGITLRIKSAVKNLRLNCSPQDEYQICRIVEAFQPK